MSLTSKITWFARYMRTFSGLSDVLAYRRLRHDHPDMPERVGVRLRGLGGRTLWCRPRTTDAWVLWRTFHEEDHLPPRPLPARCVILDLGANAGYTAAHYAHLYPEGRIIAVEMDRENAELAAVNLAGFGPRCQVVQLAVSATDGIVAYYRGNKADAFTFARGPEDKPAELRVSVPARTIDGLLDDHHLDRVDFIKMDIEGAEAEVLHPAAGWLNRVAAVTVEVHPPATLEDCAAVLRGAGFACSMPERGMPRVVAVRGGT